LDQYFLSALFAFDREAGEVSLQGTFTFICSELSLFDKLKTEIALNVAKSLRYVRCLWTIESEFGPLALLGLFVEPQLPGSLLKQVAIQALEGDLLRTLQI
jgi:hypothetical protein